MRIVFIILIIIHAIIHLFGFLKAFNFYNLDTINKEISVTIGILWLLTFFLFISGLFLMLTKSNFWWTITFFALIISQTLFFFNWESTKYGTLINIIILITVIIEFSNFSFHQKIKKEKIILLKKSKATNHKNITKDDISKLPKAIQQWLLNNGTVGKPKTSNIYLTQELLLKLKPEQTNWYKATAKQLFTTNPQAFNWSITTQVNSFLKIVGRDKLNNGNGEILIKLLSIFPIINIKENKKINEATVQRYLAEIVWFPSEALNKNIQWVSLNNNTVKATITIKNTTGSGIFYFDKDGLFKKFTALRYKDINDTEPKKWSVIAKKTEKRNGIKIPTECEANWLLDNKEWIWLKLKITNINYNISTLN